MLLTRLYTIFEPLLGEELSPKIVQSQVKRK